MIQLDTHVVSEWMKPTPAREVLAWLDRREPLERFLSTVGCAEIEAGIARPNERRA